MNESALTFHIIFITSCTLQTNYEGKVPFLSLLCETKLCNGELLLFTPKLIRLSFPADFEFLSECILKF